MMNYHDYDFNAGFLTVHADGFNPDSHPVESGKLLVENVRWKPSIGENNRVQG